MHLVKRFIIILLFITVAVAAVDARACRPMQATPEISKQRIGDAFFIGKVRLVSETKEFSLSDELEKKFESHPDDSSFMFRPALKRTYEIVQPYKYEGQDKEIEAYMDITSCDWTKPRPNVIHEVMIIRSKSGLLYLAHRGYTLTDEDKISLRDEAIVTDMLSQEIEKCAVDNGVWREYSGGHLSFGCFYKTSDHQKECSDSDNCEGKCFAELTYEERSLLTGAALNRRSPNLMLADGVDPSSTVNTNGQCSEWTEPKGCFYEVESGEVYEFKCEY